MPSPLLQKLSSKLYINSVSRNGVEHSPIRSRNVSCRNRILSRAPQRNILCSCVDDDFIVFYVLVLHFQFLAIRKLMDDLEMEMDDISKEQVNSRWSLHNSTFQLQSIVFVPRKCWLTSWKTAWRISAKRWRKSRTSSSIRTPPTDLLHARCHITTRRITSISSPATSRRECPKKNWNRNSEWNRRRWSLKF